MSAPHYLTFASDNRRRRHDPFDANQIVIDL